MLTFSSLLCCHLLPRTPAQRSTPSTRWSSRLLLPPPCLTLGYRSQAVWAVGSGGVGVGLQVWLWAQAVWAVGAAVDLLRWEKRGLGVGWAALAGLGHCWGATLLGSRWARAGLPLGSRWAPAGLALGSLIEEI